MNRRRPSAVLAVAALLALLLAGCAGLPTSGPVNAGRSVTDEEADADVAFVPAGPSQGATPAQIVEGFIAAGSGTRNNWETAQEFLTPEFRATWRPQAGVTIYRSGERALSAPAEDQVVLTVAPQALVDATGAYEVVAGEGEIAIDFRLERVGGQWRIAEAPNGIILDENFFGSVFRSYELMYFDPTWRFLVPDLRWFPTTNAATRIAEALIDGAPSPWLASSVVTAFSADIGLAQRSVPVRSGVAQVSLEGGARQLGRQVLDRMQRQLQESLLGAGIPGVEMMVDDQVLAAEPAAVASTRIDSRPLVLTENAFGFLSGTQIQEIPGLSAAVRSVDAAAIEVAASRTFAAVQTTGGEVLRVNSGGPVTVDTRGGLVPPTIDAEDFLWSVPADAPNAVVAIGPDGAWHEVADAWTGATRIAAVRVSRDGTRIAAVLRHGARASVEVAGVIRNAEGVPIRLGDSVMVAALPGDGVGLAWGDPTTLALSYTDGGQAFVLEQPVGGPGSSLRAPAAITSVAGGNQPGGVRLRDAEGNLFVQRGGSWQEQISGVRVLATQQGAPR